MTRALLALVLAACEPAPLCTAVQGITLQGSEDCHGFKLAVENALNFLPGGDNGQARYYAVKIRPDAPHPAAWCDMRTITLPSDHWEHGSGLWHELAHALDDCTTPGHEGWAKSICPIIALNNEPCPEGSS